jgi:hypothetical protein
VQEEEAEVAVRPLLRDGPPTNVTQVDGAIQGDQASGTFSRSKGTSFGIDCKISDVHWEAQPASGSSQNS